MIYMENPAKQRYYLLLVEQDLLSAWCLKRVFGSLVSRRGRIIIQHFSSKIEALQSLSEVEYAKRQRGYIYADMEQPEHYYLRPQTFSEVQQQPPATKLKLAKNNQIVEYNNLIQKDLFEFDELSWVE